MDTCPLVLAMLLFSLSHKVATRITLFPLIIKVLHWLHVLGYWTVYSWIVSSALALISTSILNLDFPLPYAQAYSRYLQEGSNSVYGWLIDASKAFDTVDHNIVFDELLTRGLLSPVIHFLFGWYQSQCLQYKVECMVIYLSLSKCLVVYNKAWA